MFDLRLVGKGRNNQVSKISILLVTTANNIISKNGQKKSNASNFSPLIINLS